METKDELGLTVERLAAAAELIERVVEKLAQRQETPFDAVEKNIDRIVAAVEASREAGLQEKLAAAEQKIADLQAREAGPAFGRKTLPGTASSLAAKHGVNLDSLDAGALDAALISLSLEQRIAVKAQLMRAGLLG